MHAKARPAHGAPCPLPPAGRRFLRFVQGGPRHSVGLFGPLLCERGAPLSFQTRPARAPASFRTSCDRGLFCSLSSRRSKATWNPLR